MKKSKNNRNTDTFRGCQLTQSRVLAHNDDADRIKEAELLTDVEFGADWDAVLTLRYKTATNDAMLIANIKMMLKQKMFNQYFYSVYIHQQVDALGIPYDYHAHIYLRHKSHKREFTDKRILSIKKAWYYTGDMGSKIKEYFSDTTNPCATVHFHLLAFVDKTNPNLGSYASYGIRRGINETKLVGVQKYPILGVQSKGFDAMAILRERGRKLRKHYGFTWEMLKQREYEAKQEVIAETNTRSNLKGSNLVDYLKDKGLSEQRLLELYGIPLSS